MYIFKRKEDLLNQIAIIKTSNKSIGFVPTMGALHQGHLSLIKQSKQDNDITVVSIFVNPTQFNDKNDFINYPNTIVEDTDNLINHDTDILFLPHKDEVYDKNYVAPYYHIGPLENIYEGEIRQGHYQGVCQVVYLLTSFIQPDNIYFGQKDYQQYLVVKKMFDITKFSVKMHIKPTVRDANNLALSSRNIKLSTEERKIAENIFLCLTEIKNELQNFVAIKNKWEQIFNKHNFQIQYLDIVNADTLQVSHNPKDNLIVLIAVKFTTIRLIDNLTINFKIT